ncbi:hypothetical protein I4U23_012840 [Adineta vaga]|nr:hypothetical protein I4U23_012840 [Adineta vaga]
MNMESFLCEESSTCKSFQSAICLHCNRRLCVLHITEHSQLNLDNHQQITKEAEEIVQHINNEYEKTREIYQNILTTVNDWRAKQLEKIGQIYEHHLQCIESRQETVNLIHQELTDLLDREVRQPLQTMQTQHSANSGGLEQVQETIKRVQEKSKELKWNFLGPILNKQMGEPAEFQASKQVSSSSDGKTHRGRRLIGSLSSLYDINLRRFRSYKRLVELFGITTNIEQNKIDLDDYIKGQEGSLPLPNVVASYIAAWYRNSNVNEKNIILKEYMSTIMKHISHDPNDYTVLIGIHAFFYNERIEGNKRELMTFILQYFVDSKCLNRNQIFYWYHNKNEYSYKGFDGAKQMTAPFIKSLWAPKTETAAQATPMQQSVDEHQEQTCE